MSRNALGQFVLGPSLIGKRFHRLVVLEDFGWNYGKNHRAKQLKCRCDCGNVTTPILSTLQSGRVKSCGCWKREIVSKVSSERTGSKHQNWRGGRIIRDGYVRLLIRGHPRSDINGYVLEHIVVMERHLGRELLPGEIVHHKYGDRSNNAIEDLELWDTSHPSGQHHVEKMAFYVQEIACKASDEELLIVNSAIQNRMKGRGIA